ncbi:hypothetical protein AD949_00120, partial [Acetobacter orleanensis]
MCKKISETRIIDFVAFFYHQLNIFFVSFMTIPHVFFWSYALFAIALTYPFFVTSKFVTSKKDGSGLLEPVWKVTDERF